MVSAKSELRRSANESLKEQQARMTQQASRGRKPAIEVAELAESFEFSRSGNGTESLCDFRYKAGAIELEPAGLRPGLAMICVCVLVFVGCGKKETPSAPQTPVPPVVGNSEQLTPPVDNVVATPAPSTTDLASQFPALAPLPDVPVPADNPISDAKVALGKLLFFDNRLSGDLGTSCASCHDSRMGWGDGQAVSRGYAGTQHWRNSQTTINSAFYTKLFWAGEVPSLEAQAVSTGRQRSYWQSGGQCGSGDGRRTHHADAGIPDSVQRSIRSRPSHVYSCDASYRDVRTRGDDFS